MRVSSIRPAAILAGIIFVFVAAWSTGRAQNGSARADNSRTSARTPVVMTTDCGAEIDDQWALTHLALSPELDLRAVVTTHASSIGFSSEASAKTADDVLAHVRPDLTPARRPPIVAGSPLPLQSTTVPRENRGVDLLIRTSRQFSPSRRLTVFVTGAATDVASAILEDPSVVNRISVVGMAFDDWPAGGDGFNVKNDPFAWQVLLDADVPLVIGSSAVTKRGLRMTRADASSLVRSHGAVGGYLFSLLDDWLTRQAAMAAQLVAPGTWVIWDEVVVAYALGLARGGDVARPRLRADLSFSHPDTSRRITWVTDIDTSRVWKDLTTKVDAGRIRQ